VRGSERDLTMADKFGVHVHLKNSLWRSIRDHPDIATSIGHPARVPGWGGHRLQQLAIPIDKPGAFGQIFRFRHVIRDGLRAGELLLGNPQALGRDRNPVGKPSGTLEQLCCFRHTRWNAPFGGRWPAASPRRSGSLLCERCARASKPQACADTRGEEFSLVHDVLLTIWLISDILFPALADQPACRIIYYFEGALEVAALEGIMQQISRRRGILALPGALANFGLALGASRATFRGVVLGTQTYSFRDRPLDEAIPAMAQIGFGCCEVSGRHVEPKDLRGSE